MEPLRALEGEALERALERLRNPLPGGKVEAAKRFGVDLTLLMAQMRLSPAERARRTHELAKLAIEARWAALRTRR